MEGLRTAHPAYSGIQDVPGSVNLPHNRKNGNVLNAQV